MASTSENTGPTEELDPVCQKMVALAQSKVKGISDKDISTEMPDLQPTEKAQAINKLLASGFFALFQQGGTLLYKLKDPSKARTAQGKDNEEKIVYTIIEEAGNKGIWIRDIRFKSNITNTVILNKILKSLESKKIIKVVKSVTAGKKKSYMLYNLEPDSSVTGGAWYQDQDFEGEFVDVLNQQCYRYLEQKRESASELNGPMAQKNASYASSQDVWKFINELGISKVKLSIQDLEMILDTLIYDGKAEKTITSDGRRLYRATKPLLDSAGLFQSPCGVCPIRKNCCDFGDVTPIKCQYISEWLNI